eukprot:9492267-Pyramimonas_sp.AAC.2
MSSHSLFIYITLYSKRNPVLLERSPTHVNWAGAREVDVYVTVFLFGAARPRGLRSRCSAVVALSICSGCSHSNRNHKEHGSRPARPISQVFS